MIKPDHPVWIWSLLTKLATSFKANSKTNLSLLSYSVFPKVLVLLIESRNKESITRTKN